MRASSGSVNRQNGTWRPVVTRSPPARLSLTTAKSSSEIWVKCGLPAQSPTAQTPPAVVCNRSFTFTRPRSVVSTPALSSPMPLVFGVRPPATSRCVPSRESSTPSRVPRSLIHSPDSPLTRVTVASVTTLMHSSGTFLPAPARYPRLRGERGDYCGRSASPRHQNGGRPRRVRVRHNQRPGPGDASGLDRVPAPRYG